MHIARLNNSTGHNRLVYVAVTQSPSISVTYNHRDLLFNPHNSVPMISKETDHHRHARTQADKSIAELIKCCFVVVQQGEDLFFRQMFGQKVTHVIFSYNSLVRTNGKVSHVGSRE